MGIELRTWLDVAGKLDMKILVVVPDHVIRHLKCKGVPECVAEYRDHPAVLAWQIMEEPSWDLPGSRAKEYAPLAYNLYHELDPTHPAVVSLCGVDNVDLYHPYADIIMRNFYPIPPSPHGVFVNSHPTFEQWKKTGVATAKVGKPWWGLSQVFDASRHKNKDNLNTEKCWRRAPDRAELRCSVYTTIASGARGVWFYNLRLMMADDVNRGWLNRTERWNTLVELTTEIRALLPVLNSPGPQFLFDNNHIATLVKSDGKDIYAISANYAFETSSTEITRGGLDFKVNLPPYGTEVQKVPDTWGLEWEEPQLPFQIGMCSVSSPRDVPYLWEAGFNSFYVSNAAMKGFPT